MMPYKVRSDEWQPKWNEWLAIPLIQLDKVEYIPDRKEQRISSELQLIIHWLKNRDRGLEVTRLYDAFDVSRWIGLTRNLPACQPVDKMFEGKLLFRLDDIDAGEFIIKLQLNPCESALMVMFKKKLTVNPDRVRAISRKS